MASAAMCEGRYRRSFIANTAPTRPHTAKRTHSIMCQYILNCAISISPMGNIVNIHFLQSKYNRSVFFVSYTLELCLGYQFFFLCYILLFDIFFLNCNLFNYNILHFILKSPWRPESVWIVQMLLSPWQFNVLWIITGCYDICSVLNTAQTIMRFHLICGQPAAVFFARAYSGIEQQNNIERRIKTLFNITL